MLRGFACLLGVMVCLGSAYGETSGGRKKTAMIQLDFGRLPLDENGMQKRPRLEIRHAKLGFVAGMQCYETGPFQVGRAKKNPDGSVVFRYANGEMTCTTTFTTLDDERIAKDVVIEGPVEQLRKIPYIGPCLQFRRAPAFTWKPDLVEFGKRCFIYTMRGPLGCHDMPRAILTNFKLDAKQNNPPVTQLYVPIDHSHPGSIWGHTAAPGMRPIHGIMALTSQDGKWLCAQANRHNNTIGQLWMPCTHYIPDLQKYLDPEAGRMVMRTMIYVMPNDPKKLLETFLRDYPDALGAKTFDVVPAADGALRVKPKAAGVPELVLALDVADASGVRAETPAPKWKQKYWGTFVRGSSSWRMWAHPYDDVLDVNVSFAADGWDAKTARSAVRLTGKGWKTVDAPDGVAAQVLRSADDKWTAAFFWEKSEDGKPGFGIPDTTDKKKDTLAARGKLLVFEGPVSTLRRRRGQTAYDWKNALPYSMPVSD